MEEQLSAAKTRAGGAPRGASCLLGGGRAPAWAADSSPSARLPELLKSRGREAGGPALLLGQKGAGGLV